MSHNEYLDLKHLRGLDGIRALSAFMVIAHHMEDQFLYWLDGSSGVSIFFVLSGYLITTLLIREERKNNTVSLKAFYIRRSFRIFPIYYVVLGIYCVLIFGLDAQTFASKRPELIVALPYYVFYLNEFLQGGTGAGFGHTWSLGIEEKFYLLWPVIGFIAMASAKKHRAMFIVAFSLSLIVLEQYMHGYHYTSYYMLLVGCLLAVLLDHRNFFALIESCVKGSGFFIVITAFIVIHLMKPYYQLLGLVYPVAVAFFIAAVVLSNSKLTNFLEMRPLKFCGQISYGIYLTHILSLNAIQFILKPGSGIFLVSLSTLILSIILATCIAYGMHIMIERPMILYGRKLASRYV